MPKTNADAKTVQLRTLTRLYQQNPGAGYTAVELAAQLGCGRRTVLRYIDELSTNGQLPVVMDEQHRYRLMEGGRVELTSLSLDLREAAALYLAARLLTQQ